MGRRDEEDEGVRFEKCVATVETAKALLVRCDDDGDAAKFNEKPEGRWLPKSCIHDDSEVNSKDDKGMLVVKTWFAKKEGIT